MNDQSEQRESRTLRQIAVRLREFSHRPLGWDEYFISLHQAGEIIASVVASGDMEAPDDVQQLAVEALMAAGPQGIPIPTQFLDPCVRFFHLAADSYFSKLEPGMVRMEPGGLSHFNNTSLDDEKKRDYIARRIHTAADVCDLAADRIEKSPSRSVLEMTLPAEVLALVDGLFDTWNAARLWLIAYQRVTHAQEIGETRAKRHRLNDAFLSAGQTLTDAIDTALHRLQSAADFICATTQQHDIGNIRRLLADLQEDATLAAGAYPEGEHRKQHLKRLDGLFHLYHALKKQNPIDEPPTTYTSDLPDPWTDPPKWYAFHLVMKWLEAHRDMRRGLLQWHEAYRRQEGVSSFAFGDPLAGFHEVVEPYEFFLNKHLDRLVDEFPEQQANVAQIRDQVCNWRVFPVTAKEDDPQEMAIARAIDLITTCYRNAGRRTPVGVVIPVSEGGDVARSDGNGGWAWKWAEGDEPSNERDAAGSEQSDDRVIEPKESEMPEPCWEIMQLIESGGADSVPKDKLPSGQEYDDALETLRRTGFVTTTNTSAILHPAGREALAQRTLQQPPPPNEPPFFVPTKADHNILEALAASATVLHQVDIEMASGEPSRTVKDRMPILETAELVLRPHGPRKGYAITEAGQQLLGPPGAR